MKLGATGQFPDGKINRSDEGGIALGVAYDPTKNLVRIDFGKPVAWLALPPESAIEFAKLLLKHAGAKKVEISL